ncbi:MAG: hypothetical protein RI897_1428 [Verrucomicrobiota bacterium]
MEGFESVGLEVKFLEVEEVGGERCAGDVIKAEEEFYELGGAGETFERADVVLVGVERKELLDICLG